MIVMYVGSLFLLVLGYLFIRQDIRAWQGKLLPLGLRLSGLDGALLILGVTLACAAVLDLGDAISVHGTRSNAGLWIMAVSGVALMPSAFLFASVWFFNRPRFLVPPGLRDRPGALMRRRRHTGG